MLTGVNRALDSRRRPNVSAQWRVHRRHRPASAHVQEELQMRAFHRDDEVRGLCAVDRGRLPDEHRPRLPASDDAVSYDPTRTSLRVANAQRIFLSKFGGGITALPERVSALLARFRERTISVTSSAPTIAVPQLVRSPVQQAGRSSPARLLQLQCVRGVGHWRAGAGQGVNHNPHSVEETLCGRTSVQT